MREQQQLGIRVVEAQELTVREQCQRIMEIWIRRRASHQGTGLRSVPVFLFV